MKTFTLTLALLLTSGIMTLSAKTKREMYFSNMLEEFANPSKEYRSAPLWVWNTDVKRSDIDRMLHELKEQGFGGAFVHPRPGLETEYLSKEWFDLWEYSLNKGKELGLDIWIYDENSYPSGFAGGHVPHEMPESYNQGQALKGKRSKEAPAVGDCYLCLLREKDTFRDITAQLANYQGKPGDYYIYRLAFKESSPWTAGMPYVDLLAKGVTEKFINITMRNGYEKYLGHRFGSEIKGTFTDEPNIASPSLHDCRWTPDLFDVFKEMWGYDLRTHWPQLGEKVGDWKKVRHDYNAALLRLFIDRWARPWHDYCESKHISFTGHYWEHAWPNLNTGPDNMAMYAWHQLPAIDMLFNQYDDDNKCQAQFGNIRSVKEVRSVANQMGYDRILSESYAGGGWEESLLDFKRLGDWEYALGINFLNQHLSHMTITGARKFDYPPVFTSLSPWWKNYGEQNTYFARLSATLSQGEQINNWLLIEPTTSLWLHFTRVGGGQPLWQIANTFQALVSNLEKKQMEFDLGCEDIIMRHGSVTPSGFSIGKRTYSHIVIPPYTENLEGSTFKLLRQFAEQGGKILTYAIPTRIDGAENEEVKTFFSSKQVTQLDDENQLLELFQEQSKVKITALSGNHVFHYRSSYKDGELVFIANSSLEETASVAISLPGKYLYNLDAMTGKVKLLEQKEGNTSLERSITLPASGSALYFASGNPILSAEKSSPEHPFYQTLKAENKVQIHPVRQNAMILDFCTLNIGGKQHDNVFHKAANELMWKHFNMTDPWERAIQYRKTTLERDTFSMGEIKVSYSFTITEDFDWKTLTATIEKPWMWTIKVNNQLVENHTEDSILDHRCGVYHIGKAIRHGKNTLEISMPRMNIRAEIAPVILQGSFSTIPANQGFTLGKPGQKFTLGTYASQGLHFYPWEVSYSKVYNIKDAKRPYQIKLGKWTSTVAEVWINGVKEGSIAYPPYTFDINNQLRKGKNTIEVRVIGSLANLYGPHFAEYNGLVGPKNWNDITETRPGNKYNIRPYGLEEDFQVLF